MSREGNGPQDWQPQTALGASRAIMDTRHPTGAADVEGVVRVRGYGFAASVTKRDRRQRLLWACFLVLWPSNRAPGQIRASGAFLCKRAVVFRLKITTVVLSRLPRGFSRDHPVGFPAFDMSFTCCAFQRAGCKRWLGRQLDRRRPIASCKSRKYSEHTLSYWAKYGKQCACRFVSP